MALLIPSTIPIMISLPQPHASEARFKIWSFTLLNPSLTAPNTLDMAFDIPDTRLLNTEHTAFLIPSNTEETALLMEFQILINVSFMLFIMDTTISLIAFHADTATSFMAVITDEMASFIAFQMDTVTSFMVFITVVMASLMAFHAAVTASLIESTIVVMT